MVIDSSAVVAILFGEQDSEWLEAAILGDGIRFLSAASLLECSIVLDRSRGGNAPNELDLFVQSNMIEIVPVTAEQIVIARHAFRQFGKGNHKAGLNFGDCFSYALAKVSGEPLLFKGDDFGLTDLNLVSR